MTSPGTRTIKVAVDGDARGLTRAAGQGERALLGIDKQTTATALGAGKLDQAFATAATSVIRDLDRMEQEAWAAGDGMDAAFSRNLDSIREEIRRLAAEGDRTGASLESDLGNALRSVREQADKAGKDLHEALNPPEQEGWFDDLLGDIPRGKAAGLAAGTAVGGAIWAGLQQEWAEDKVGALIAAQTGAARGSAEQLGTLAGDIFLAGFGDSVEQVGEAMSAVFANELIDTSAPEAAIDRVTKKVLTLTQTTGDGAAEISQAARQLLVTGLAENMTAAMDIIQRATELGLNSTGELLDTINEYSTQFRSLGLNAQDAFGLLEQAADGGARNVDIAADALKEFQIRAQDMSVTTRRGFEGLGLDADVMGQRVAKGGASARDALRDVLNRLNEMPDSVERNSIAIDLFGTQAEDLGDALFSMDLDTATQEFGDFGAAVEKASQKLSDGQSIWDKVGKGFASMSDAAGEFFGVNDFEGPLARFRENGVAWKLAIEEFNSTGSTRGFDELKRKFPEAAAGIDSLIEKMGGARDSTDDAAEAAERYVGNLDQLISRQREFQTGAIDLTSAQISQAESFAAAEEAMQQFADQGLTPSRNAFDLSTEAGREMESALNDVAASTFDTIEAMRQQNVDSKTIQATLATSKQRFIDLAASMGLSGTAAQGLADKLFGIPDEVIPTVGIRDFASGPLKTIVDRINAIKANPVLTQDVWVYTHAVQSSGGTRSQSGSYQGYGGLATGGPVWPGRVYEVGERGRELFVGPNTGGRIIPNHQLPDGNVAVHVTIDGEQLQGRIDRTVRENNRAIRRATTSGTGRAR